MTRIKHIVPTEKFWLDETDPAELRRRASDWEATSHFGLAEEFRARADMLERRATTARDEAVSGEREAE